MQHCQICPRGCGVNRLAGERGVCGMVGNRVRLARAALHHWEEPCISGERGSGAVFFSGCSLGCVFCQNQEISHGGSGEDVSVGRLADIFLELAGQGAHNINLVTPTHYTPHILEALASAKARGLGIPVVYNTGGYEKPETIALFNGLVDVFLPDFKYMDESVALRYSHAPDYAAHAKAALAQMARQAGSPMFEGDGMIRSGVIVRHLALPGLAEDSRRIIDYLHETYGDGIYLSLMNQYTPMGDIAQYPELNRKLTRGAYTRLVAYAIDRGVENGFIQEQGSAETRFIPPFCTQDLAGAQSTQKGVDTHEI